MSGDALATAFVLAAIFALLARDRLPPSGVLLGGLTVLVLGGVIEPQAGFAGFSNQAPLTVAALYVIAGGARRTGLLTGVTGLVLGGRGGRTSLARLCFPVAAMSAVFNNTPLVAMLLSDVATWARARRIPVSRFLMPLSFAAILGGTVTLIGTSTNLVVSGVLEQQGLEPFGLFELAPIGLPVATIGLTVMILAAKRLLPDRAAPGSATLQSLRDFTLHLEVATGGPLVGLTVADAGLRSLSGVYLADLVRGDRHIGPVSPDEVLDAADLLVFVGDLSDVIDLRERVGLVVPADQAALLATAREPQYFEVVVGRESPLVGRTLKDMNGRSDYQAAAVAIHRSGARLDGKLGDVVLHPGDALILLAASDLRTTRGAAADFLVIAPLDNSVPVVGRGARWVALALAVFAIVAVSEIVSTLEAAMLAAVIVVASRVITFAEAKRSIDLDVVLMISASLGIGSAVEASGLATNIAHFASTTLGFAGTAGVVIGILLTTTALTEIVTNNAAAAVIVPIALRTATELGLDPRTMAVGVAVMASSSFLSPIGYQTNTMVYGPGGYHFGDFARLGIPVNLTVLVSTTILVLMLG